MRVASFCHFSSYKLGHHSLDSTTLEPNTREAASAAAASTRQPFFSRVAHPRSASAPSLRSSSRLKPVASFAQASCISPVCSSRRVVLLLFTHFPRSSCGSRPTGAETQWSRPSNTRKCARRHVPPCACNPHTAKMSRPEVARVLCLRVGWEKATAILSSTFHDVEDLSNVSSSVRGARCVDVQARIGAVTRNRLE